MKIRRESTVSCCKCDERISPRAKVCPVCGAKTSRFFRGFQVFANDWIPVLTFVGIAIGLAFTGYQAYEIRKSGETATAQLQLLVHSDSLAQVLISKLDTTAGLLNEQLNVKKEELHQKAATEERRRLEHIATDKPFLTVTKVVFDQFGGLKPMLKNQGNSRAYEPTVDITVLNESSDTIHRIPQITLDTMDRNAVRGLNTFFPVNCKDTIAVRLLVKWSSELIARDSNAQFFECYRTHPDSACQCVALARENSLLFDKRQ